MAGLKYLFQSMNVLNGLLSAAVATVVYCNVDSFLNLDVQMSLPAAKKTVERSGGEPVLPQNYSPVNYAMISEQNLFHPERKIPPEKQAEEVIQKPEVILYGTLIMDDGSIAFIEDKKTPYSTPGRGKRQVALKKGYQLNGYILTEITPNHIVFVKGKEKIMVMLDDGEKRKSGPATTPSATSSMRTGGSPPVTIHSVPPVQPPSSRRPQRPLWK